MTSPCKYDDKLHGSEIFLTRSDDSAGQPRSGLSHDRGPLRFGSPAFVSLLLACAGVLLIARPASAQEGADAPKAEEKASEQQPPQEAAPEQPAAPEQAPKDQAPAAEKAPAAPAAAPPLAAPEPSSEAPELSSDAPELSSGPPRMDSRNEIVVTGYRKSLDAALARKKRSSDQVDAIVADDMADFPDLNLAESLQRMPGISITRTNGEGSRLTVRGLSGQYTRTRVNGMDTRAAAADNTSREFDFNMFASELFSSIVVHKTASAELGEGSLGAVVDLNTARPFDYKKGFTYAVNAQGNFNDLSMTVRPRVAGLISYHAPNDIWGASASVAYSLSRNDQAISDTVRWEKGIYRSVNGVTCSPMRATETDPGCSDVNNAFGARIPRYMEMVTTTERLGLTAGVQVKPTKKTDIRLDGLYAMYNTEGNSKPLEVLFRGNQRSIDVTGYTLDMNPLRYGEPNNTLDSLSVNNAWVRSEANRRLTESDFYQVSLALDHEFTEAFYVKVLAGRSQSKGHVPHNTTLMYDNRAYNGFSYDYRGSPYLPKLIYGGASVTDPTNFTLTELRDQVHTTTNTFDTGELKLFYEFFAPLRASTGVTYKRMAHDTKQQQRDGTICALGLHDCDTNDDGMNDSLGPTGTAGLSDQTHYGGPHGVGSTTDWVSPSIDGWVNQLGYYNVPLKDDLSRTRTVEEQTLGTYVQLDGEIPLGVGEMRIMYNAGVQYVQTRQTSGGYVGATSSGQPEFKLVERPMYDDWLPSANAAVWLTNDYVVRLAAARVLSRPALADLTPGGSVDGFNYAINYENPYLEPTRATALDFATEWYFAKESMLGAAVFWKKIDSFPIDDTQTGTFASTGLPESVIPPTSPASMTPEGSCGEPEGCWQITRLTNGPGATIKGIELAFQAPLSAFSDHLPPVIRGLGVTGNVTFVDSQVEYQFNGNVLTESLMGLSNRSYNATLYYEDSRFGARVSAAHRSNYLLSEGGTNQSGNLFAFVESSTRFDFSSSFKFTEQLVASLEILNLADSPYYSQVDIDAKRLFEYKKTGRNYLLGLRYSN